MNRSLMLSIFLIITLLTPAISFAIEGMRGMRYQADSQFRIAEKAYRKAIREYGESLKGLPDDEKGLACRKMSSALHDNRTQYDMEDVFNQMKYKKQVQKLEGYSKALGCPN